MSRMLLGELSPQPVPPTEQLEDNNQQCKPSSCTHLVPPLHLCLLMWKDRHLGLYSDTHSVQPQPFFREIKLAKGYQKTVRRSTQKFWVCIMSLFTTLLPLTSTCPTAKLLYWCVCHLWSYVDQCHKIWWTPSFSDLSCSACSFCRATATPNNLSASSKPHHGYCSPQKMLLTESSLSYFVILGIYSHHTVRDVEGVKTISQLLSHHRM